MTPHKKRISQLVFRSIVIGLAVGFASTAQANPLTPTVVSGSATIATSGNTMTVTNTPGAIINWQQFNIGQSEVLKFIQQSAQSSVLNRVISQNPSQILGTLQSNGRVFLINPSGVMFGQGSIVNVNGLVASTLNISDSDFLLNRFNFIGSNSTSVINKGEITTPLGGSVYLIGNSVSNEGVITSPKGEVILAAGNSVSLLDTGTPHVTVTLNAPDNQAVNLGQIVAENGQVNIYGALLSQQGLISANSASLDAQGNIVLKASQSLTLGQGSVTTANGPQGGTITAQASEGKTTVSGRVEATGNNGSGGSISLLGNEVALTDTARIDASGSTGGGKVLVGGDFQGKNAAVQNAQITYLAQGASIKADAVNNGEGGKVILWADEATGAFGNISAKGGALGGNGGFVEVSGKEYLAFDAQVDTSAPFGNAGTLLLDPTDITIVSGAATPPTAGLFTSGIFDGGAGYSSNITWGTIQSQLAGNNVIIQTTSSGGGTGNITVSGSPTGSSLSINHTSTSGTWSNNYSNLYSSSNNLSLLAGNKVDINAQFGNAGTGAITIIAGWNGNVATPDLITNYSSGKDININSGAGIIANGALTLKAADTILFTPSAASSVIDMNTEALTMVANRIYLDARTAASNARASIITNGNQSFTLGRPGGSSADGLLLDGANGAHIYGGQAEIRRFGGSGGQSFTFNNGSDLILKGGAGDGLVPSGSWTGSCADGNCSGNSAEIENYASGDQTFTFASGGSLELTGGSGGNSNRAEIQSKSAQIISGNPAISLQGGSSGGTMVNGYLFENEAGIDSKVSQTINAASIVMNGGAANYGGAYLGAPVQTINVTGNVSLTGGSAAAPTAFDHNGKPVFTTGVAIGSDDKDSTSHSLTLTIGGYLSLEGGAINDYGGSYALIGGYRIPTTLTIDTTGDINLNGAGAGRDQIGSYGGYGGSVHLHSSGGSVNLGKSFVGTGTTGTMYIEALNDIIQSATGQIKSGEITLKQTSTSSGGITIRGSVIAEKTFLSTSNTFDLWGSITANGLANHFSSNWNSSTGKYIQSDLFVRSSFTNNSGTISTPNGGWIVRLGSGVVGVTNAIGTGPVSYADLVALGYSTSDPLSNEHFYYELPIATTIDPCQINPANCVVKTSDSTFTSTFAKITDLEISGATGDVTFDPNLKVAGGEITFISTGQTTAGSEITKAEGEIKQAEVEIKMAKTPKAKAQAEMKKSEAEGKKAEAESKKAEAEAKQAEVEEKTANTPVEKAKAEMKKTEAEGRMAEAESRKAEADAKKAEVEGKQAEAEGKKAEAAAKTAKTPEDKARAEKTAEASKAEAEGKKAEVIAKKSEAEAKKAEAEVKKADVEEKTAKTPVEKARAEMKKTEAEGRRAEAESRKAEAEAKKAEVEGKQAEGEGKTAEAAAKSAKTPEDKARAEKTAEASKAEAEGKKTEVTAKKSEAEAKKAESEVKKAEIEEQTANTPVEKAKAEVKKTEAEGRKAEAESRKAEAEAKKSEVEAKQAEGEAKGAKSAEKKVEAEKKSEFKKAEAEAKKAESETKKAEAEEKKTKLEAKSEKSEEKKAEAEKKLENKKAEEAVKKAEAQKKESEYKKAEAERKEAGIKSFGKLAVAAMSKDNLKAMLDVRHEYKTDALKTALTILDRNPAAADMSACGAGESGACIQQPAAQITASLLPAPAIPQISFLPQIQHKVAVVIGINNYQDKIIPSLEGAVPDANAVSKMFKENMGYDVRVIHDGTKSEIVQAINKVAGEVGANDSVTIYYAGHGYEMETTKTGYWIPSDGSAKSPANWISSNDINKMLSNIKAKQVLLVSDSCFSGNLAKEQKVSAVQGSAEDILSKRSVLVMSSGGDEPVSDEGRDGHSVFAWHFMDKLKGVNKYEQGSKLYEGVKTGVTADGFPQTPQYGASVTAGHSTGGDYLFEVRK